MTKNKFVLPLMGLLVVVLGACAGIQNADDETTKDLTEEIADDSAQSPVSEDKTESELEDFAGENKPGPVAEEPFKDEMVGEKTAPPNSVTAINYLSSVNGGTIEIKTSVPAVYSVRANPEANQYVIEIQNAALAKSLRRPYLMKDFTGAFGAVNAYQNPGGNISRIVLQMKQSGEPVISQEGNTLLVMPPGQESAPVMAKNPPPTTDEGVAKESEFSEADKISYNTKEAQKDEKILSARTLDEFLMGGGKFYGRPISIQTNEAEVRDVISFIAEESGVNLVLSDDVDGKVSVKLRQVPWDQALVIIMRARALGYVRQGNVLRITKLSTLQAETTAAKDMVEAQKKLTPLKVKVMPVSYAAIEDLTAQLKPFLTEQRGQVVGDKRTSSIVVTDTAEALMRIEHLVKELDIPPTQVMIEGKIVEATENFTRRIGVNWSLSGSQVDIARNSGINGTNLRATPQFSVSPLDSSQIQAGNGFLGLRVGTLDFFGNLDATLSLAQSDSLVRIISSPRIVTMNKEKSLISQKGEVITIKTTVDQNNNKTFSAERSPVELKLDVTPQITNEGSVVLDVDMTRQFAGAEADSNTKARPINTRQAKTKVLVPNGQTAVIGGIYQSDETESETGVPWLKDVPVLGWLFKQKTSDRQKNELLLFLTPRILNPKDQSVTN